ncbi:MAG TPA: hypothetical protein VFX76_16055, partial [Roseiflexaceae bacterium]|nr:hypothetical protein [Roseiflexaceae bacterium]
SSSLRNALSRPQEPGNISACARRPAFRPSKISRPDVSAAAQPQAQRAIQQACQEYLVGFENAYRLTFYFALLAIVIGAFMPGWPFAWAGRGAVEASKPAAH